MSQSLNFIEARANESCVDNDNESESRIMEITGEGNEGCGEFSFGLFETDLATEARPCYVEGCREECVESINVTPVISAFCEGHYHMYCILPSCRMLRCNNRKYCSYVHLAFHTVNWELDDGDPLHLFNIGDKAA